MKTNRQIIEKFEESDYYSANFEAKGKWIEIGFDYSNSCNVVIYINDNKTYDFRLDNNDAINKIPRYIIKGLNDYLLDEQKI